MQVKTRKITVSAIVGSAAFQRGVSDYLNQRPFAVDDFDARNSWHYERGRLFAAAQKGEGLPIPPSRNGRAVSRDAIRAVHRQFNLQSLR